MSKPILWDLVNTLYHGVMDNMPNFLQEKDMASAFTLGTLGTYGVVRGIQLIFNKQWISNIDSDHEGPLERFNEVILPKLEKICAIGVGIAPVVYFTLDPEGAREVITQHPTYTSGMAGVYVGSIAAVLQDLHKRFKESKWIL